MNMARRFVVLHYLILFVDTFFIEIICIHRRFYSVIRRKKLKLHLRVLLNPITYHTHIIYELY